MTNSTSRRRVAGVLAALLVIAAIFTYLTWRLQITSRAGWAGFAYVPPIGSQKAGPSITSLSPGQVFMVYAGGPAERAGLRRGDIVRSINGVPASDLVKLTPVANALKRGDAVRYTLLRDGRPVNISFPLGTPFSSPMFAMSFATSCVVALTFLVLGIFVFWRLPSDSRAVIFFVMTLVAAVTLASTAVLQAEGSNMRGIVSAQDSFRQLWEVILLLAAGVFFAPLLLHLALIFPKERPVIARRPYIFRWVYGVPIGICVYALFLLTTFTALENRVVPKDAARIFAGIVVVAAIAACVALIGQMVRKGFLEGFLTSPIPIVTLIDTTFLLVLVLGGRNAALTKSAIPFFATIMVMVLFGILLFSSYPIATFVSLYRSYRESGAEERRQVKWPLWGTMVAVGGKLILSVLGFAIIFLSTFSHLDVPAAMTSAPDIVGRLLYVLIPLSFALAILKYRLMNIDVIIRRTVLYSILTFVVFALYGVLVISVGTVLVKFAGLQSQTMLVASTVVIALAAVPIRNRLQEIVDRNLFRQKRDYALGLRNISNAIGDRSVDDFLRYSVEQIQEALQNRMVLIAMRRDHEFVAAAKVGVSDEIIGRVRVPVDADLTTVPEPLSRIGVTLMVHVRAHRDALALLAVGSKLSDESYGPDDLDFLNSAASQIAVGIENVRLRGEEVDFEQARAMQQILLPTRFPQLDRIEITGMWQPARSVGGDYFDTLALGGSKAAICIGDVAGKGMPAALLMANLQAAVKATAAPTVEPAIVCERVKDIVGGNLVGGKFISFFYGVVDAAARTFTYSNAGHNPPILVRADSSVERLSRGGPAMCRLFKDVPQEQDLATLRAGDRIVLFTDGVSEARRGEEEFGDDRLIELIIRHPHLGARELQQRIADALRDFAGGDFSDDVTLVVIAVR